MSLTKRVVVIGLWAGSLVGVGVWAHAQSPLAAPTIISGNDLGFRVEGHKAGKPVGVLVVRVNGQWVEAGSSMGVQRLTVK
jgi:hypothetical protein